MRQTEILKKSVSEQSGRFFCFSGVDKGQEKIPHRLMRDFCINP
jgi:hypothetical protein